MRLGSVPPCPPSLWTHFFFLLLRRFIIHTSANYFHFPICLNIQFFAFRRQGLQISYPETDASLLVPCLFIRGSSPGPPRSRHLSTYSDPRTHVLLRKLGRHRLLPLQAGQQAAVHSRLAPAPPGPPQTPESLSRFFCRRRSRAATANPFSPRSSSHRLSSRLSPHHLPRKLYQALQVLFRNKRPSFRSLCLPPFSLSHLVPVSPCSRPGGQVSAEGRDLSLLLLLQSLHLLLQFFHPKLLLPLILQFLLFSLFSLPGWSSIHERLFDLEPLLVRPLSPSVSSKLQPRD